MWFFQTPLPGQCKQAAYSGFGELSGINSRATSTDVVTSGSIKASFGVVFPCLHSVEQAELEAWTQRPLREGGRDNSKRSLTGDWQLKGVGLCGGLILKKAA